MASAQKLGLRPNIFNALEKEFKMDWVVHCTLWHWPTSANHVVPEFHKHLPENATLRKVWM